VADSASVPCLFVKTSVWYAAPPFQPDPRHIDDMLRLFVDRPRAWWKEI
jgi:hypothetical protein